MLWGWHLTGIEVLLFAGEELQQRYCYNGMVGICVLGFVSFCGYGGPRVTAGCRGISALPQTRRERKLNYAVVR